MKELIAESIDVFIQLVSELQKENGDLWFRGHANVEWKLIPRLYRRLKAGDKPREEDDDNREHFIRVGPSVTDVKPSDKWDWYFVMQHHGVPTRLLDWTESALIGLFFAVRENEAAHDAAVWILDPWELNGYVVKRKEVLPPGEPGLTDHDRKLYDRWLRPRFAKRGSWPPRPVAVFPRYSTRRIAAQKSCFTIHGSDPRGLEKIVARLDLPLTKIVVPSWAVAAIQRSLETCGIDEATVFPDLDGLGKYLSIEGKKGEGKLPHQEVYVRLRPSKIDKEGVGTFAIRRIKKGTLLFRNDNEAMRWIEEAKLPRAPRSIRRLYEDFAVIKKGIVGKKTTRRYGCPLSFDQLTPAWHLNDSKKPNVGCDNYYNFFALRDIESGEELTVDYSTYSE